MVTADRRAVDLDRIIRRTPDGCAASQDVRDVGRARPPHQQGLPGVVRRRASACSRDTCCSRSCKALDNFPSRHVVPALRRRSREARIVISGGPRASRSAPALAGADAGCFKLGLRRAELTVHQSNHLGVITQLLLKRRNALSGRGQLRRRHAWPPRAPRALPERCCGGRSLEPALQFKGALLGQLRRPLASTSRCCASSSELSSLAMRRRPPRLR